jgi:protein phosphatase
METPDPPTRSNPAPRAAASRPQPPPRAPREAAAPQVVATPRSVVETALHVTFGAGVEQTDLGRRMTENEDASLVLADTPLWAIADASGARWPAELTLDTLSKDASALREFQTRVARSGDSSSRLAVGHFFESVINRASEAVRSEVHRRGNRRATATCVALTLMGPFAYVAHVGDSRAYLWRDRKLRCLTTDHTLAMLQLKRGELTADTYAQSPFRKTLTQAIGVTNDLRPDIAEIRVAPGDVLLLCSDGLHRMLSDRRIAEILVRDMPLAAKAEALVAAANEAGGKDNITLQLVPVEGTDPAPEEGAAKRERIDIARVLGKCFLFQDLSESERLLITPYFEYQTYAQNDLICREGAEGDSLFVIVSGKARVTYRRAHLVDLGPGGYAGEIALARVGPRTATIVAVQPTVA